MSHFISLAEAVDMTSRYRSNKEGILGTNYRNLNILPVCETFDRAAFDSLLSKEGCDQVRIYYWMDSNLKIHAIIVAADAEGADLLPSTSLNEDEEYDIIDRANRCPDLCPPASALNS